MSDITAVPLAATIDRLLDRVEYDLCPDPELPPTSEAKRERLARRRDIAKRNCLITRRYYGLDGAGGSSMEQVGEPFGLTRESVRQITNKVADRLRSLDGIPRTEFARAMRVVRDEIPASKSQVEQALIRSGLWCEDRDVTALLAASRLLLKSEERNFAEQVICTSESDGLAGFLVFREQAEWPRLILSAANRLVSHNGATTLAQVCKAFSIAEQKRRDTLIDRARKAKKPKPAFRSSAQITTEFARAVIDSQPDRLWLCDSKSWFTLPGAKRNRVVNRLAKIFSCYRTAQLADVAEAIKRSLQKNRSEGSHSLPFEVLAALIESRPGFTLSNGQVGYEGEDLGGGALPAERALVDFIAVSDSGIRRERELEEGVINTISRRAHPDDKEPTIERVRPLLEGEPEIGEYGFSMALNFSPLIMSVLSMSESGPERVRGHYRLVGVLR